MYDECITFKQHVDCVAKTIARNIGVMNKLKYFIPKRILHTLYCTLVLPYLNYNILIWGSTCKTYMDKIVKLQKWAMRTISCSHYRSHTDPIFAEFKMLKVFDMFTLELGSFMFKYSSNDLPPVFANYFKKRSEIHNYTTRYKDNYHYTNNKRTFSDHSVRTLGPHLWNSLDKSIQNSKTLKQFRNKLKQNFISNYV